MNQPTNNGGGNNKNKHIRLTASSSVQDRRAAFEKHTREYFSLVRNVSQSLQSEIYALEMAKILPTELPKPSAPPASVATSSAGPGPSGPATGPATGAGAGAGSATTAPGTAPTDKVGANGGMGQFDIGILNSRAEDAALAKRRELVADALKLLNPAPPGGGSDLTAVPRT